MSTIANLYPDDFYDDHGPVMHSFASGSFYPDRTYVGWKADTSIKSDFGSSDFEYFRSDRLPRTDREFIMAGQKCYDGLGIIRNVVDLMADFASQGIKIEHPVPRYERLFNRWFKRVNGKNRSERFLNLLYRLGNVPVYRSFGKVSVKGSKKLMSATAEVTDDGLKMETETVKKNIVPLQYSFINPIGLELANPALAAFGGKRRYYIYFPDDLISEVRKTYEDDPSILEDVPTDILKSLAKGDNKVLIDSDRLSIYFYKKDDWMDWARPMTSSILTDIRLLNRLKLADTAALDGAISNIRLWTIGWKGDTAAETFIPKKSMIEKVRNILAQNVGGGVMDLVWGPELSFTESKSEVYKFLTPDKYIPTLDAIYDGLGIPPTLRSGGGTTNTNNFMSLKTLIERLNYGRDVLTEFWMNELTIVQKAFGIAKAPTITFPTTSWSDETGEKKLLLELADRNITTDDRVRERFGIPPEVEGAKLRKQENERGKHIPAKAGPYHTAEKEHEYKKIAMTSGSVTPSELGVELEPRKAGEVPVIDKQIKIKKQQAASLTGKSKSKGTSKGRPKNVKETKKRKAKPKDVKTLSSRAELEDFSSKFLWANDAQNAIGEIVIPKMLSQYGKANVRSLTKAQVADLEKVKTQVLFSMASFSPINEETVYNKLELRQELTAEAQNIIQGFIDNFRATNKKEPTIEEIRNIYSTTFALIN